MEGAVQHYSITSLGLLASLGVPFLWSVHLSSIDAAADYPKILDADWSIQILDQSASRIAYLGQAMLDNPLIC